MFDILSKYEKKKHSQSVFRLNWPQCVRKWRKSKCFSKFSLIFLLHFWTHSGQFNLNILSQQKVFGCFFKKIPPVSYFIETKCIFNEYVFLTLDFHVYYRYIYSNFIIFEKIIKKYLKIIATSKFILSGQINFFSRPSTKRVMV